MFTSTIVGMEGSVSPSSLCGSCKKTDRRVQEKNSRNDFAEFFAPLLKLHFFIIIRQPTVSLKVRHGVLQGTTVTVSTLFRVNSQGYTVKNTKIYYEESNTRNLLLVTVALVETFVSFCTCRLRGLDLTR